MNELSDKEIKEMTRKISRINFKSFRRESDGAVSEHNSFYNLTEESSIILAETLYKAGYRKPPKLSIDKEKLVEELEKIELNPKHYTPISQHGLFGHRHLTKYGAISILSQLLPYLKQKEVEAVKKVVDNKDDMFVPNPADFVSLVMTIKE